MCAIGLFQIRLSIFFYFLRSSGTNRRRTLFLLHKKRTLGIATESYGDLRRYTEDFPISPQLHFIHRRKALDISVSNNIFFLVFSLTRDILFSENKRKESFLCHLQRLFISQTESCWIKITSLFHSDRNGSV